MEGHQPSVSRPDGFLITPQLFRRLCGHFATGVTIVTAFDSDDTPSGMTANSFAAVSLEPPLISIAVDHEATIYPAMQHTRTFTINILDASQEALSRRFAEGLENRFDGVEWTREDDGALVLRGALAHIRCEKWSEVLAGDHTLFIGRVTGGDADPDGEPLTHFRGRYGAGISPMIS